MEALYPRFHGIVGKALNLASEDRLAFLHTLSELFNHHGAVSSSEPSVSFL